MEIRKRWNGIAASVAIIAIFSSSFVAGQAQKKLRRIGILCSSVRPAPPNSRPIGALPGFFAELGYIEGKTVSLEWRFANGDYSHLPDLANDLAKSGVDIIVTDGTPGIRAAQGATNTIPIVFNGGSDLVASGLVKRLARPGGNTTGFSLLLSDTAPKQLELLTAMIPKLSRIAVLSNPANSAAPSLVKSIIEAAAARKMRAIQVESRTPHEIEIAMVSAMKEGSEALIWIVDSFLSQQQGQIRDLATRYHLPTMCGYPEYAEGGGLMGYGPNRRELWRNLAGYVDKILKGANPGDLPVQQPTKLELVINRKAANELGLKIPPELLILADRGVIE